MWVNIILNGGTGEWTEIMVCNVIVGLHAHEQHITLGEYIVAKENSALKKEDPTITIGTRKESNDCQILQS